ncbi:MAG: hypothetical protein DRJ40_10225 [Thermoprotei archaeon]|mgnify:CR=1 FL=1|nr:MAG: hypothetical protein DRJ40_10225 [Thermoprotei archaeon]
MGLELWFDVLTPKHARMASVLYHELGGRVLVTCREHDCTRYILEKYGVKYVCIGKYGGGTREGKLRAYAERVLKLVDLISSSGTRVHVSMCSPEGVRVAFGLGKPILLLVDTPHSYYVCRLTVPLASALLLPKCITADRLSYALPRCGVVIEYFDGVFEVAWILRHRVDPDELSKLGLEEFRYILVRTGETLASYYSARDVTGVDQVLHLLSEKLPSNTKILAIPRYPEHVEYLEKLRRVIVPREPVDTLSLCRYAIAVISGGGTVATEAALLGTPAITVFPHDFEVRKFVASRGYPLYWCPNPYEAVKKVLSIVKRVKAHRGDLLKVSDVLEDPIPKIIQICRQFLDSS